MFARQNEYEISSTGKASQHSQTHGSAADKASSNASKTSKNAAAKERPDLEKDTKNIASLEDMFDDAHQTLRDNLSHYARTYKETGKIDFVGSEIVARMANEGTVLVPDQAERLMRKIHKAAHQVQQFTLRLQTELQSKSSHKDSLQQGIHLILLDLYRETTALLTTVELHVIPLVGLVQLDWRSEMLRVISALRTTLDNWVQLLSQEVNALENPQQNKYYRLIYQSTLFSSKVEELRIRSLEVVMKRVPLYRVLN